MRGNAAAISRLQLILLRDPDLAIVNPVGMRSMGSKSTCRILNLYLFYANIVLGSRHFINNANSTMYKYSKFSYKMLNKKFKTGICY